MAKVPTFLVITCCECAEHQVVPEDHVPLPKLTPWLWRNGKWVLSVVTPPGEGRVAMAPLCWRCCERVYPPELSKRTEQEMNDRHPPEA